MKAVQRTKYGSPDTLRIEDVEVPTPEDREVLVRVHATTINRTDCGILRGTPFPLRFFTGLFKPKLATLGTDFAGHVVAVGERVTIWKVGDRVWGFNDEGLGSQAEYMTIKVDEAIARIPEEVSYETIVACGEGAHYAYNFMNKVTIEPGTKVLVNGATGAIGSALVQLLKHRGAYVTAVGNTKNIELMKSWGTDNVIDYLKSDFTKNEERYHYVFDAVGKSTFGRCKRLLLPGGSYISSELGPYAENVYLPMMARLRGNKRVIFPIPSNCQRSVDFVTDLVRAKQFSAVIDRTYSIDQIRDAYHYVERGEKTGNVVVTY